MQPVYETSWQRITQRSSGRAMLLLVGCGLLLAVGVDAQAAVAPMSRQAMKKKARYIVSGRVVAVTSQVQKSKIEKGFGIYRDRVYSIRIRVDSISMGSGLKPGQEVLVRAWRPETRIPPLPGPQGHVPIPEKNDRVTVYVARKLAAGYEPFLPNGIVISKPEDKQDKHDKQQQPDETPRTRTAGFTRQYVKRAVLSKEQEKVVVELARKRGIPKVASISTYNLYPTAARGIRVQGEDAIQGRNVSCKVLNVRYKSWWHPNQGPRKGDLQSGDFWAGQPTTQKQIILKVGRKEYRTRSVQGLTIEQCESMLGLFLAGKYVVGPGVNRSKLNQINWKQPNGFHKRDDAISISFPHKDAGAGFFDLQVKLDKKQLTITQMFQAVP